MNATTPGNRQPESPGWKPILTNVAIFQIAWFACVLGGAAGKPSVGIAVVTAAVAYHLYMARRPLPEAALLSLAALIGAFWDGQLIGHGWLVYPSGIVAEWIAPTWIIAMWVSFATTLNVSLRWLHGRYGLAMILGALGGPLAFYAGERLAGVQFSDPLVALSVLSAGWALITPTLVLAAGHLDGYASTNPHTPDTKPIRSHA